ncbi:hypothetical protein [Achromobacter denitrificans]|uniref:hypothetical protein n=1 Tax=Achromobacter denitrificans TaxID=32002 RepID=UPI003B9C1134
MTTPNLTAQADVAIDPMAGTLADTYARAHVSDASDPWARDGAQTSTITPPRRANAGSTVAPSVGADIVYAVLGIDPGPTQTGWCVYLPDTHRVLSCGVADNAKMLERLQTVRYSRVAMEMIASYGMPVGREVFETCVWIGRFMQALALPESVDLVYRKDVKMHLCGTNKAKDGNVRQAILDLFPRTGGGATPQVGTKGQPGPLYGVSTHAWPALGVAITSNARSGRQPQERKA